MDIKTIDVNLLEMMFKQSNQELKRNMELVNDLNVYPVPDGDTGTNMSLTMESAIENLSIDGQETIESIANDLSKGSLMGARGNSGVILSQIFRGFSKGCQGKDKLTPIDLANALQSASDCAYDAVMKPVEGTILTVIRKTAEAANEFVKDDTTIDELIEYILVVSKKALDKTPEQLKVLKQANVVDAGGRGLFCIFKGFEHAISGKELLDEQESKIEEKNKTINSPDEIEFGYCTEFFVKGNISTEILKEKIQTLGDSMVFVNNDDLTKVHIHTNNPGIALQYALEEGSLEKIKIENMRRQHSELIKKENEEIEKEKEQKDYDIIAIAVGDGIEDIFRDLGVTKIIKGGQTMNPSTKDLLQKIDESNAKNIIILPNNSNIILAAEQAKEISDKNIHILPTKTIPQGINSLIEFDFNNDVESNLEIMESAIEIVKTIEITYAVRDTTFDNKEIKKGEILGVTEGEITETGSDLHDITIDTVKKSIDEDTEIVTIYYGDEADKETAIELSEEIEQMLDFGDVEVYYGGQPLYYYLISVE
ncbi:MAG: DAK2 domain-containing protein [Bacillota bacterium]